MTYEILKTRERDILSKQLNRSLIVILRIAQTHTKRLFPSFHYIYSFFLHSSRLTEKSRAATCPDLTIHNNRDIIEEAGVALTD